MGTTRDALNAGSTSYVLVAAVEGHHELFTNAGDTAAVTTAWADTGWETVKGGLFAEMQISQALNPDNPIATQGTCNLWMAPQGEGPDDVFGVAVGRKTATFETMLAASMDPDDTTASVLSTSGADSTGFIHIGTECIEYSGTTATTFTGLTRGRFSVFGSFDDYINARTEATFGHPHHVGEDSNSVNLQSIVSSGPRIWIGRWVGVWAHQIASDGTLDTKAEAELLFAGRIVDIRDDANTGAVAIQVKSAADLSDVTIGSAQWEADSDQGGVFLSTGMKFYFGDFDGTTPGTADPLEVVASGAIGANQMNEGYYSLGDLCSALSAWFADENDDTNIVGSYSMLSPVGIPGGALRTKIYWSLPGALVAWVFSMPSIVSTFFGFDRISATDTTHPENKTVTYNNVGSTDQHWHDGDTPNTVILPSDGGPNARALFSTASGEVADQLDTLPGSIIGVAGSVGGTWGVFQAGKRLFRAQYTDNLDGTVELLYIQALFEDDIPTKPITAASDSGELITIKQIYIFQTDPITMLVSLLCSMGADGYNSPYNALPPGCSASIPYELVRSLANTMSGLAGIVGPAGMTVVVEKPTKLVEILQAEFAIRWVFLYWHLGEISMGEWQAPSIATAVEALTTSNKAVPAGDGTNQNAATGESAEWLRPVVKVRYNRNSVDPSGDDYQSTVTYVDRTSVDDMGGSGKVITLNLRNTYADLDSGLQSIKSLLSRYLSILPLCSRASRKLTRPLAPTHFLRIGIGHVVTVTDTHARDPETGLRGLTSRPALVTKHTWSLGGNDIGGGVAPIVGSVDLLFSDYNPDKAGAPYVPAGMVNDLYTLGSFDHGYNNTDKQLRLLTNRFTETTDGQGSDASFLNPGDKIMIIERDPADPDAPVYWDRTLSSDPTAVAGDIITMTATLSSPSFDNAKQYYVISQPYDDATTSQHGNVYQADASDGLILDTTSAYRYGSGGASSTFTTNEDLTDVYPFTDVNAIEMIPTIVRIDGAGRDVAWEAALARLGNNLVDYKLAPQIPMLSNVVMSNTTVTGTGYLLVDYWPVWLNFEIPSASIFRYINLAPWAYSTDGTSTKIRVTVSRERPSFITTANVPWAGIYGQAEWTGITSTTPGQLVDKQIAVNLKDPNGEAWIAVECGFKCATRRLSKFSVGARQVA